MHQPHPRQSTFLSGHKEISEQLVKNFAANRLPHALLFTGPKGIGKSTLAYHLARHVLSQKPHAGSIRSLKLKGMDQGEAVFEQDRSVSALVAAESHVDLFVIEKGVNLKTGRAKQEITVDAARRLKQFFSLTAVSSLWRVAIIDAVDEMNRNASNAILKALEEPPKHTLLVLISHTHSLLLETISSRCQRYLFHPLSWDDFGSVMSGLDGGLEEDKLKLLFYMADGSPGSAKRILENDGIELYREFIELFSQAPAIDFSKVHRLADLLSGRGSEEKFDVAMNLLLKWISSSIKSRFIIEDNSEVVCGQFSAVSEIISINKLDEWVRLWEETRHLVDELNRVNLDRKNVLLSTFSAIESLSKG